MVSSPQRKLALNLRKGVHVIRRMRMEHLGGGVIRWTCLTCGWTTDKGAELPDGSTIPAQLAEKLAKYQMTNSTAVGECERCTRKARDQRYPLPPK